MHELILKIENDPTMMFMAIIALVVLLVIVLTIIVSAMRVKSYKDKWWNLSIDNKKKIAYIQSLEKELQEYKIEDAKNQQELAHFQETKDVLEATAERLKALQKSTNELEKELSQTKAKLEGAENLYENQMKEHRILKERFDTMMEENTKYRVNNARLLMKLESEGRQKNET